MSKWHFEKLLHNQGLDADVSLDDYAENFFLKGRTLYGPYWTHLQDAWAYRHQSNFKFVWYEDMRSDLKSVIQDLAAFTGYELSSEQVERLVQHCDIEKFKKNDAVNMKPPKGMVPDEVRQKFNFIRKGKVGDWKSTIESEQMLQHFDAWIGENNTENIPIRYTE